MSDLRTEQSYIVRELLVLDDATNGTVFAFLSLSSLTLTDFEFASADKSMSQLSTGAPDEVVRSESLIWCFKMSSKQIILCLSAVDLFAAEAGSLQCLRH